MRSQRVQAYTQVNRFASTYRQTFAHRHFHKVVKAAAGPDRKLLWCVTLRLRLRTRATKREGQFRQNQNYAKANRGQPSPFSVFGPMFRAGPSCQFQIEKRASEKRHVPFAVCRSHASLLCSRWTCAILADSMLIEILILLARGHALHGAWSCSPPEYPVWAAVTGGDAIH